MHAKFLCETDLGERLASLNVRMLVNSLSKDMVREWINEVKKGKVAGPSGLVLTPVDKVGIDMLVENCSTSYSSRKGNISANFNCFKGKGDALVGEIIGD